MRFRAIIGLGLVPGQQTSHEMTFQLFLPSYVTPGMVKRSKNSVKKRIKIYADHVVFIAKNYSAIITQGKPPINYLHIPKLKTRLRVFQNN